MADLSDEDIKDLIEGGSIRAITIDTSIFDRHECNLGYKTLVALEQFKGTDIRFLLSPVVMGEIRRHIAIQIDTAAEKARAGINQLRKALRSDMNLEELLTAVGAKIEGSAAATAMVDAYVTKTGATIIATEVPSGELLRRYFGSIAPFGMKSDKKSEFPDAIALLGLEKWARDQGVMVLVVSKDGDWQEFCRQSKELVCLSRLPPALDLFHSQESVVASRISKLIRSNDSVELTDIIIDQLQRYVEDFDIEATSAYYFDEEPIAGYVTNWRVSDRPISVVDSDNGQITLSFEIEFEARFEVWFRFSLRDGIDRDYVSIGRSKERQTVDLAVTATATFSKDKTPELAILEVEIEHRSLLIDFGDVEPS